MVQCRGLGAVFRGNCTGGTGEGGGAETGGGGGGEEPGGGGGEGGRGGGEGEGEPAKNGQLLE